MASSMHVHDDGQHGRERRALVGDKYELGEELGRGAFGVVFKGTDVKTGDVVAIKQISLSGMSQDRLQSIMLEIDLLKFLNHDNIVKYIGSYKTRSHLDIILEFMEQGALSQLIKKDRWGLLPEHMIAAFISQVLQGLHYLHGQGVVHRDIKGANILLGAAGQVKLADFGVATRGEENNGSEDFDPVGTPYWMAPEVIELTGSTAPSDIWSVGCLIIELYTGSPPYFDLQPMSALYRIVQDPCVPLPTGLSPELQAFLRRCFQKDPQDRPGAADLLQDAWLLSNQRTLRMSWSKSAGLAARGLKPRDAHETISSVVERILEHSQSHDAARSGPLQKSVQRMGPPRPSSSSRRPPLAVTAVPSVPDPESVRSSKEGGLPVELPSSLPAPPVRNLVVTAASQTPENNNNKSNNNTDGHNHSATPVLASIMNPESKATLPREAPTADARLDRVLDDLLQRRTSGHPLLLEPAVTSVDVSASSPPQQSSLPDSPRSHLSQDRPRQASVVASYAGLALGVRNGSGATGDENADMDTMRQELQELRGKVAVLHDMQQRETSASIASACHAIQHMLVHKAYAKQWFLEESGIITMMEILQQTDVVLLTAALDLLLAIVSADSPVLESLCLVGIVPIVNKLTAPSLNAAIRQRAATFVQLLCRTSPHTVQIFVACGGVAVLVGLLEADVRSDAALISIGLDSIWSVLQVHGPTPVNHYCRLLAKADLVTHLLKALSTIIALEKQRTSAGLTGPDDPPGPLHRQLVDSACDLLVVMSNADSVVKSHVSQPRNLQALLAIMQELPSGLLRKMLDAVRMLSTDPQVLRQMQDARAVPLLVQFLRRGGTESGVELDIHLQLPLLEALHNLCKVSKERQLEAATANVTSVLLQLVDRCNQRTAAARRRSLGTTPEADTAVSAKIRALCISLLCALAHSNSRTRNELWACQGLDLFIDLLRDRDWKRQALDALSIWLQEDIQRMEPKLLVKRNIAIIVNMFREATSSQERLLTAFKGMLTCSPKLCVQFGSQSDLPAIMMDKLSSANPFLTTCILDVVQSLYDSHPRPKEFILKYHLVRNLDNVRKRHGDAIKVLDKCDMLLKAIQVNSVL